MLYCLSRGLPIPLGKRISLRLLMPQFTVQLSRPESILKAKTARGQGEPSTRDARSGSYGNGDASVSTRPCYQPNGATNSASETECDEARRAHIGVEFRFGAGHSDRDGAC